MRWSGLTCFVLTFSLAAGCATQETPVQRATRMEQLLAAAGFHTHPADTPDRVANLEALEPLKIRFVPKNGKMHYWYADPVYCHCLYVGNQDAYDRYQQLRVQQGLAAREEEAAELNQSAAMEMSYPLWPDPYFY